MSEQDKDFVEKNFVFCGLRFAIDNKLYIEIRPMAQDGTLEKDRWFDYTKKRELIIGGVYSGASFSEGSARGLQNVVYESIYADTEQRTVWRALSDEARDQEKKYKLIKNVKKMNEVDEILLPLRKIYSSARRRNDHATLSALEHAVIRSLTTPVRKAEDQ